MFKCNQCIGETQPCTLINDKEIELEKTKIYESGYEQQVKLLYKNAGCTNHSLEMF